MGRARRVHKTCPFPTSHKSHLLRPCRLLLKSYETPKAGGAAMDQLLGEQRGLAQLNGTEYGKPLVIPLHSHLACDLSCTPVLEGWK